MANRTKAERNIHITTSAFLFAKHTRDAEKIADIMNTSKRSVLRWSETPLFDETLQTLGYTGERHFRVRPARDVERDDPTFETVKNAYQLARDQGVPKHKRVSTVAQQTGVKDWKIRAWIRKYRWDD